MAAAGLDPHRVENVVGPGFPDVSYAEGLIELKALEGWPMRLQTPVRLKEFTGEQAGWLARRWQAKGAAWLMVRVDREWFLFDGWTAMQVRSGLPREAWRKLAAWSFRVGNAGWNTPRGLPLLCRILRLDLEETPAADRARLYRLTCFKPGEQPKAPEVVAQDLGWSVRLLLDVEQGLSSATELSDLLAYWES